MGKEKGTNGVTPYWEKDHEDFQKANEKVLVLRAACRITLTSPLKLLALQNPNL